MRDIDRSHDLLSPDQIDKLDNARGDRRLDAYYFGFRATGVQEVDRILAAIASAGKAYHSTESWDESSDWRDADAPSFVDLIQSAANSAAAAFSPPENVEEPTTLLGTPWTLSHEVTPHTMTYEGADERLIGLDTECETRGHRWRFVDERNAFVCLDCGAWDYADDGPDFGVGSHRWPDDGGEAIDPWEDA